MQGVGTEYRIVTADRPGTEQVKFERRQNIGERGFFKPGADAGQIIRPVAGLPDEMRQMLTEMDGVLAGAATNFKHMPAVGEDCAQYGEDGFAVLFS